MYQHMILTLYSGTNCNVSFLLFCYQFFRNLAPFKSKPDVYTASDCFLSLCLRYSPLIKNTKNIFIKSYYANSNMVLLFLDIHDSLNIHVCSGNISFFPRLKKLRNSYIQLIVGFWARSLLRLAGGTIEFHGRENLPSTRNVCYIANHQGGFDIPIMLSVLPGPIGFIAKKELALIPIINLWMWGIGCVFINRQNRRTSVVSMRKGVEQIKQGNPMIIFPEGTRSRGPKINEFRAGSLKLATRSEALIVPVTISGSYSLKELKGKISPGHVTVTVHKPLTHEEYSRFSTGDLSDKLAETIKGAL